MSRMDDLVLENIRQEILELPEELREQVVQAERAIRIEMVKHGPAAFMALALIGAEIAANGE